MTFSLQGFPALHPNDYPDPGGSTRGTCVMKGNLSNINGNNECRFFVLVSRRL